MTRIRMNDSTRQQIRELFLLAPGGQDYVGVNSYDNDRAECPKETEFQAVFSANPTRFPEVSFRTYIKLVMARTRGVPQ